MAAVFKIVFVAISLALDVFAVSIGVGVRGASTRTKVRIGIMFAASEILMNLLGVVLGFGAGKLIGDAAGYLGFLALVGVGVYMTIEAARNQVDRKPIDMASGWGLVVASLAISLDSLGIGFSILYIGVPLVISMVVIGIVSIASTTLGLTIGRALGARIEERAELLGGVLLALTGGVFIALKALHVS